MLRHAAACCGMLRHAAAMSSIFILWWKNVWWLNLILPESTVIFMECDIFNNLMFDFICRLGNAWYQGIHHRWHFQKSMSGALAGGAKKKGRAAWNGEPEYCLEKSWLSWQFSMKYVATCCTIVAIINRLMLADCQVFSNAFVWGSHWLYQPS